MRKVSALASAAGAALRTDAKVLVALAVLVLTFPALALSAWFTLGPLLAVALLASQLADGYAASRLPRLFDELESAWWGGLVRQLVRDALLILFLARTQVQPGNLVGWLAAALLGTYLLIGGCQLARALLQRRRAIPIQTHNVDLSALRLPSAPARALRLPAPIMLAIAAAPAELGAVAGGLAGRRTPVVLGGVLAVALALLALVAIVAEVARNRSLRDRGRLFRYTLSQLVAPGPQVVLYHSGGPGTAYQVNMWLPALAALDRPALVILRQPEQLVELVPTTVPVAAIASASDVMDLALPTARLALYPANVGDNLHLIRQPGLVHVFVGHGDSDKAASATRISRIYDQIWVAGPAGRDRYRAADIGIADADVVEVGRPQLAGLTTARELTGDGLTVLYAPTWEGWSADMNVTSVPSMGVQLVEAVLASGPGVRLLYKPHPLAGVRSAAMRSAHAQIRRLIEANARGRPGQPVAVEADGPDLYSCFNAADVLISDISSVLSDFAATRKPYLVTNPTGLPVDRFTAENPAAAGGYILNPGCAELPELLADLRRGADPLRIDRDLARHRLLGPDDLDPAARFRAAVAAVTDRSTASIPRPARRSTVLSTAAAAPQPAGAESAS